jgi:molybdopterin-guanine dinucleotide biosynthesis protein A
MDFRCYDTPMRHAGFVLTGGRSSRMGTDKALLPYLSRSLADHVARQVRVAAGNVSLIGHPKLYAHLGFPVYPDQCPSKGPLGGIHTALSRTAADWNLIVACDLPNVRSRELRRILQAADSARDSVKCVVPCSGPKGWQPLCAAYHARCLPAVERALRQDSLKMKDLLAQMECVLLSDLDPELFVNVNTPWDWERIGARRNG